MLAEFSDRPATRLSFLRRVVEFAALLAATTVASATDSPDLPLPGQKLHGPLAFLQQNLVLSAEDARLIAAAERQLEIGDKGLAFQALLVVFAHEHDAFTPLSPGRPSGSSYQAALRLLQQADYSTRKAWAAEVSPLAKAALASAGSDTFAIERVARHFPYTEPGLQAHVLSVMLAKTRGQQELAFSLLGELTKAYADTTVEFDARKQIARLRTRLGPDQVRRPTQSSRQRIAGESTAAPPQQLRLPWPEPVWTWQESVWDYPQGVPSFAGLSQPRQRSSLSKNTWRPMLTSDAIIQRTPFRIVALDKVSGKLKWSIQTDTLSDSQPIDEVASTAALSSPTAISELLQMDDLGTMAVSNRFLYFIDHFRRFEERPRFQRSQADLSRPLPPRERAGGSRLVAVQLGSTPGIAWTLGDVPEFSYEFAGGEQRRPESATASSTVVSTQSSPARDEAAEKLSDPLDADASQSPFRNQHFLGVPLVHDQMLYIMSADAETISLNCITEATGRLLWKVPVAYESDATSGGLEMYLVQPETSLGASLCGIADDTVVCVMKNGMIIGVSVTDGTFRWATNVRNDEHSVKIRGRRRFPVYADTSYRISFPPLLNQGRLYWAARQSDNVVCVDTKTGAILWESPRVVAASGRMEGSEDQYAVAVADERLVLIGDRHIRALNIDDGDQVWVSALMPQTGRAVCNGRTCLVPLQNDSVACVDVATGSTNLVAEDLMRQSSQPVVGTLFAEEDQTFAATPLTVRAFPTLSKVTDGDSGKVSDSDHAAQNAEEINQRAKARVLSGDLEAGAALLSQIAFHEDVESAAIEEAQRLLIRTTLQSLAAAKYQQLRLSDAARSNALKRLQRLPLTTEQSLRLASIVGGKPPRTPVAGEAVLLDLLPGWRVRSDVVAWSSADHKAALKIAPFRVDTAVSVQQAEHAILFPQHVGTAADQQKFARLLTKQNRHTAAELFLLAAESQATENDQALLRKTLTELRATFQKRLTAEAEPTGVPRNFEITETLRLTSDNRIAELIRANHEPLSTPAWYTDRLFVGSSGMLRVNMHTGSVSPPIRLPASPRKTIAGAGTNAPGLLPLVDPPFVGVVSLAQVDGPALLWWKRLHLSETDASPIRSGPFGPGYAVYHTDSRVFCLHPLTGDILWSREISLGTGQRNLFSQNIRFAGDHQAIAIFGKQLGSCEVYRTLDGQFLGTTSLEIPENTLPLVSGRNVLYQEDDRLHLMDLLSGKDLLEKSEPLKILRGGTARVISEERAVMLSEELDLLVLNMQTGLPELRCSVAKPLDGQKIAGLSAFERDGRLFVLVKDFGQPYSQQQASSSMHEVRLDSGMLFCLSPDAGELIWHQKTAPAILPPVYGDPTNLMVKWTTQNSDARWHQNLRGRVIRRMGSEFSSLRLTIIDGSTGDTLHEQENFADEEPIRCYHNAEAQTITIDTEFSQIEVKYSGPKD